MDETGLENNSSSTRFKFLAELGNTLGYNVNLRNPDNLKSPNGKPIILAATHTSDRDMPAIMGALASRMDLRIPYISELVNEEPTATIMKLMGSEHWISLDYEKTETGEWQAKKFNPKNFQPATEALKNGATVLIAAHDPAYEYILPNHGGNGAVWLAHEADAVIIPVAVDTHEPDLVGVPKAGRRQSLATKFRRPTVDVIIGTPIKLTALPDGNGKITKDNVRRIHAESDHVMKQLSEMLPAAQRGIWATKK